MQYISAFSFWLHGSEHSVYSLCSLQTYIMYLIKYLAITIYFSVMSNKLLPYHIRRKSQNSGNLTITGNTSI